MVSIFSLIGNIQRIEELEIAGLLAGFDDCLSQSNGSLAAFHPMTRDNRVHGARFDGGLADHFHFGGCVIGEGVDRHHHVHAVFERVLDVLDHVGQALLQQVEVLVGVFGGQRFTSHHLRAAAVHLEGADGGHQHHHIRDQPGVAALDVHEFFHADVRAEAGFGDDVIGHLERDLVSDDGGLSVRDIGKRSRVNDGGSPLEGLHQVRLDGVLHQDGQRASHTQIFGGDGFALALLTATTMRPRRSRMSARSVVSARMAMISEATVIS